MDLYIIIPEKTAGWHTLHEIAVSKKFHSKGVGQQLFNIVPLQMRLKTTVDNIKALSFYAKNNINIIRKEIGKKRELIVRENTMKARFKKSQKN